MKLLLICAIAIHFFCSLAIASAPVCVNDDDGKTTPQNMDLLAAFNKASSPLLTAYRTSIKPATTPAKGCAPCSTKAGPGIETSVKRLDQLTSAISFPKIKKECIVASLRRSPGNKGYTCENNNPRTTFENSGKETPCVTDDMANYIQFAVNKAIECVSPQDNPIDPRFILQKINNETAFNYFIGYEGGRGITQLTSPAIKAITGWSVIRNKKKVDVEGEANYLLTDLAENSDPSCAPFKKIAEEDLKDPPNLYGRGSNFCEWQSAGEGVTRNLIYGLTYYVHIRDNIIGPYLSKHAPKLSKDPDVVNDFTLVAYRSPADAKALMARLRVSNSSNVATLKQQIRRNNPYMNQTAEKMGELNEKLNPGKKATTADLRGDACVSR